MSKEPRHARPDEQFTVRDSLGIVLYKADGSIITNKPIIINTEYLLKMVEEAEQDNNVM